MNYPQSHILKGFAGLLVAVTLGWVVYLVVVAQVWPLLPIVLGGAIFAGYIAIDSLAYLWATLERLH